MTEEEVDKIKEIYKKNWRGFLPDEYQEIIYLIDAYMIAKNLDTVTINPLPCSTCGKYTIIHQGYRNDLMSKIECDCFEMLGRYADRNELIKNWNERNRI